MKDVLWIVITALGAATPGAPAGAQGPPDFQAMLKWQQAQAIHYDVVAEYVGAVPTLALPPNSPIGVAATQVTAAVSEYPNEKGVCTSLNMPARTTMDTQGLLVPLGMYFAMAQAVPSNIIVGKDGQTMTLKDAAWTYSYKLRIVK